MEKKKSEASKNVGVGFLELLTVLFIGLKLGHVITWSWFWVLSPIGLPIIFALGVIVIMGVIGVLVELGKLIFK